MERSLGFGTSCRELVSVLESSLIGQCAAEIFGKTPSLQTLFGIVVPIGGALNVA